MTFDLDLYLQGHSTLFWLGIQHDSILWVIMKRRGVSSERKRSSCSSLCICSNFFFVLLFGIYTSADIQLMRLTNFSLEKCCKITDDNFSVIHVWKLINFNNYLIEYCSLRCDSWEVIISLANSFVPMMTQFRDNHMLY